MISAKWATVQVGGGRTVAEVAAELSCDWHTVNDAVCTYGEALLSADRKRLNRTSAIGLDETSFVKRSKRNHTDYATTVADVENHQIIEILPTRKYTDVAGWIDKQPRPWKERIRFGALDMSATYAAVYSVMLPKASPGRRPLPCHLTGQPGPRCGPPAGANRTDRAPGPTVSPGDGIADTNTGRLGVVHSSRFSGRLSSRTPFR